MNVEVALITKIIETGDLTTVIDNQIDSHYFSGRNKKAFKYIKEYQVKYGIVPKHSTFERKYPDYELMDVDDIDEPMQFYCDEVRQKVKHNTIADSLEEMQNALNERETDKAYNILKKTVLKVENDIVLTDKKEVAVGAQQRLEQYQKRAKSGGMTGILFGMDKVDYLLKGINPGEVMTVSAYTGVGKSWFEIICAVNQAKEGYKVLFFTTEMSTDLVMRRIDAVWNKLSYTRFRDGKLTSSEYDRYKKYVKDMEKSGESNLIVEQATGGISQISAKIDQYQPDVVYIDGGYLLSDEEKGEDDWMGLVRIWRGIHRLALLKKVPIIISTQSKDKKVSLSTTSFAKAIAQDSDIFIGLEQDEQMFNDKELKIKPLKIREGEIGGNAIINWDFDTPNWSSIYVEGGRVEEVPEGVKSLKKNTDRKLVKTNDKSEKKKLSRVS